VGGPYEVLLLAGIDYTLLAAGYKDDVTIYEGQENIVTIDTYTLPPQWNTQSETYTHDGKGTPDEDDDEHIFASYPGLNTIQRVWEMELSILTNMPTKSTNDFVFEANLTYDNTPVPDLIIVDGDEMERYVNVAPFVTGSAARVGDISPHKDTFRVTFNIAKLNPLILADQASVPDPETHVAPRGLTIRDYQVFLRPRTVYDTIPAVRLKLDENDRKDDPADAAKEDNEKKVTAKYDHSFFGSTEVGFVLTDLDKTYALVSFVNTPKDSDGALPNVDTDMILQFELGYSAFGLSSSNSILGSGHPKRWIIRNGLSAAAEDYKSAGNGKSPVASGKGATPGSRIVVIFGSGRQKQYSVKVPLGGN
jgi:hypothetical protein